MQVRRSHSPEGHMPKLKYFDFFRSLLVLGILDRSTKTQGLLVFEHKFRAIQKLN
jgi:hypothetical protein